MARTCSTSMQSKELLVAGDCASFQTPARPPTHGLGKVAAWLSELQFCPKLFQNRRFILTSTKVLYWSFLKVFVLRHKTNSSSPVIVCTCCRLPASHACIYKVTQLWKSGKLTICQQAVPLNKANKNWMKISLPPNCQCICSMPQQMSLHQFRSNLWSLSSLTPAPNCAESWQTRRDREDWWNIDGYWTH